MSGYVVRRVVVLGDSCRVDKPLRVRRVVVVCSYMRMDDPSTSRLVTFDEDDVAKRNRDF